jgi:hypothetical protein
VKWHFMLRLSHEDFHEAPTARAGAGEEFNHWASPVSFCGVGQK